MLEQQLQFARASNDGDLDVAHAGQRIGTIRAVESPPGPGVLDGVTVHRFDTPDRQGEAREYFVEAIDDARAAAGLERSRRVPRPHEDAPDGHWEMYELHTSTRNVHAVRELHADGLVDGDTRQRAEQAYSVAFDGSPPDRPPMPAPERPPASVPSRGAGRAPAMDR